MISIDKNIWRPLSEAKHSSAYKIFLYIAINQPDDGIEGFKISKEQLEIDLKLKRTQIFDSLKFLKDNYLIQELKLVDKSDFMATPYYVFNNSDPAERKAEWSRRCRLDGERRSRLFKEKQRRELRKQKKLQNQPENPTQDAQNPN